MCLLWLYTTEQRKIPLHFLSVVNGGWNDWIYFNERSATFNEGSLVEQVPVVIMCPRSWSEFLDQILWSDEAKVTLCN